MRNPAARGATTGLSNAFRQVSTERFTSVRPLRQDLFIARRYGLPPATAGLIAELAYPEIDSWRART